MNTQHEVTGITEDTITIKIAPDLHDIRFQKWTLSTVFNGLLIKYKVKHTRMTPYQAKNALQMAIALSSRTHQISNILNRSGLVGELTVTKV